VLDTARGYTERLELAEFKLGELDKKSAEYIQDDDLLQQRLALADSAGDREIGAYISIFKIGFLL